MINNKKTITAVISTLFLFYCNTNFITQQIKIGTQTWAKKNLDVSTFRNGEAILEAKTGEEWVVADKAKKPAWCYYGNDPDNGEEYGKLYNWYAVNDKRGLAPKGWHIPSNAEWTTLTNYLGGDSIAGTKMKSTSGWYYGYGVNGTNTVGFAALPGGFRFSGEGGVFVSLGSTGEWWSSEEASTRFAGEWWSSEEGSTRFACGRSLYYGNSYVMRDTVHKGSGRSVRCLRD